MKRRILISSIVLFGLVLLGLFVLVEQVDASITNTQSTGMLQVLDQPVKASWIYQADRNGTYNLSSRTVTGNGTLLMNGPLRPTEEFVMGGLKYDLYINVSLWDVGLTNLTVRLYGTNWTNATFFEDITVTGNGRTYVSNYYRTLNGSRVRWFWKTTGTPSVVVNITQSKWGVVWKLNTTSYRFDHSYIKLNGASSHTWWNETNMSFVFRPDATTYCFLAGMSGITWGRLTVSGIGLDGNIVLAEKFSAASQNFIYVESSDTPPCPTIRLYGCMLQAHTSASGGGIMNMQQSEFDARNTVFEGIYHSSSNLTYMNHVTFYDVAYGGASPLGGIGGITSIGLFNDVTIYRSSRAVYLLGANPFVAENLTIRDLGSTGCLFRSFSAFALPVRYLRNLDTDTWKASFAGVNYSAKIYAQYSVRLKTVINGSGVALSGVVCKMYEQYNNTGWTLNYTKTSDANGFISQTWLNKSKWESPRLYPKRTYIVKLVFEKPGYENLSMTMELTSPQNLTVVMHENYTSGLVVAENIVGATGTHEYAWFPLLGLHGEWWVWANYTGNAGGASLLVHNPNPGNGTHSTNYLQANTACSTCVDVSYQNFSNKIEYDNCTTKEPIMESLYYADNWNAQSFHNDTNSFILTKVGLNCFRRTTANIYDLTVGIYDYGVDDKPDIKLYDFTVNGSVIDTVDSWVNFSLPVPFYIPLGTKYFLVLSYSGGDGPAGLVPDYIGVEGNITNEYKLGNATYSFDGGLTWNFYSTLFGSDIYDINFKLFGVPAWSNLVNLTFSSNSSGSWMNYSYQYAAMNGTVCILNPNMTSNNTVYFWRVNWSTTEISEAGFDIFTFTTASRMMLMPLSKNSIALGAGVGCLFCVPLFFVLRRKKR